MSMRDIMNHPSKPIVGEKYAVTGITLGETEDRYHPGLMRPLLILNTDKGSIYATNRMANEAAADPDEAAEVLVGSTVMAYEYYSKAAGRDCIGLKIVTE